MGTGNNPDLKAKKIVECINELVAAKAKLNLSDKDGCFPLDLAAKFGLTDLLKTMISAGGDIHHKSKNRYTPLHWAAAGGFAGKQRNEIVVLKMNIFRLCGDINCF